MERLREAARDEDRPISEIVRRATEEYLDKLPTKTRGGSTTTIPTFEGGKTLVAPDQFRDLAHADRTGSNSTVLSEILPFWNILLQRNRRLKGSAFSMMK